MLFRSSLTHKRRVLVMIGISMSILIPLTPMRIIKGAADYEEINSNSLDS